MKVIRAKSAGFCWGVERAIEIAQGLAEKTGTNVYTDGPLIHNRQMMEKLRSDGIFEASEYQDSETSNGDQKRGVIVVRAHGISPDRRQYLKSLPMEFHDATCPDVGIIAGKIRIHAKKGYSTLIYGDKDHAEVIGLLGYTEGRGYVIKTQADVDRLPPLEKVCMVSQSTQFTDQFEALAAYVRLKFPNLEVFDTICEATKSRQTDLVQISGEAEALVVIGGHHSANTLHLAQLARQSGKPTYHIETASEIDPQEMSRFKCVGVTAGASTPEFLIKEVVQRLEDIPSLA